MLTTVHNTFIKNYLKKAPIPLATERSLECEILSQQRFVKPVLDIGCGEGLFAHILFSEKIAVGIDPNGKELEKAREYQGYEELIQCYGDKIPKKDESFNTIFSNSVIEHIENIEPVIAEMYRLLSQVGSVYLTLPTDLFEQYTIGNRVLSFFSLHRLAMKYRKFFNKFWRHYHCYNRQTWETLFIKHGFKIENCIPYGSKKFCSLNDLLAPLCLLSFLTKKLTNRWFLFPQAENIIASIKNFFMGPMVSSKEMNLQQSGLIFFHLKKQ